MLISALPSPKDKRVLKKLIQDYNESGIEYHLPKDVIGMDKPALLSIIYRLLAKVEE